MELIILAKKDSEPKRRSYLSRAPGWFWEDGRVTRDLDELLELYKQEPMAQRSIDIKAKDLFEAGFEIVGLEEEESNVIDELKLLLKKIRFKDKASAWARDAMVYGNGFMEILYAGDTASPDEPPNGNDIADIVLVSPRQIIIVEDNDPESDNYGQIVGYLSIPPMGGNKFPDRLIIDKSEVGLYQGRLIHPDRILHLKFNSLSDSHLGMSLLEPAYHVLKSKIDADKVLGTIMVRFAKPILDITVENGTAEEIKKAGQYAAVMNQYVDKISFFAHDDKLNLDIKGAQGKAIPPRDYMDYLVEQLAVCFGIPKTLIVGAEQGSISGSDLNLVSYFQSLEKDQQTILTPLILELFRRYWWVKYGQELPEGIDIKWNRLYSDELASEKFKTLGTQNLIAAYKSGLLPKEGARKKLCEMYDIKYVEDEDAYEKPQKMPPPQKNPENPSNPEQKINPFGEGENGKDNS